jgi:hypothetical protein
MERWLCTCSGHLLNAVMGLKSQPIHRPKHDFKDRALVTTSPEESPETRLTAPEQLESDSTPDFDPQKVPEVTPEGAEA